MEDAELFLGLGSSLRAFDFRPVVSRGFQGVHVSAETLRGTESEAGGGAEGRARADPRLDPAECRPDVGRPPGSAECRPDAGRPPGSAQAQRIAGEPGVSAETARRLACDSAVVAMRHRRDSGVLDVGRRRRTVPPALRRALDQRDRGCRFPGCGARFCDAHHVHHWAQGGTTRLDNLLLLCRHHHRRVHEEGWSVTLEDGGEARFHRPDGRLLPGVPETPAVPLDPVATLERRPADQGIGPGTATSRWTGERLDTGSRRLRGDVRPAVGRRKPASPRSVRQRWAVGSRRLRGDVRQRWAVGRGRLRRASAVRGAVIPRGANPSLHLANRTD